MRGATGLGLVAFLLSSIVGACGGPPPSHCPGTTCMCGNDKNCDLECPASGCVTECGGVSNCGAQCGEACELTCRDSSNCDLACGDGCTAVCESVSVCNLECGADCDVTCNNLSNCEVVMISGEVRCSGVSDCDVGCALPNGAIEPAQDCGEGRFRCPVGAC
jgi:hypothetical protein